MTLVPGTVGGMGDQSASADLHFLELCTLDILGVLDSIQSNTLITQRKVLRS